MADTKICTVEGCGRTVQSKGLCGRHYNMNRLKGRTTKLTAEDRFLRAVDKSSGPTGCWLWTRSTYGKGYGNFRYNGRSGSAHRASYQMYKGPIPPGMEILHLCDNPRCVNPLHLRAGTHRENMQDMAIRGRAIKFPERVELVAKRLGISKNTLYWRIGVYGWDIATSALRGSRRKPTIKNAVQKAARRAAPEAVSCVGRVPEWSNGADCKSVHAEMA